ncbi:hypothetical protein F5141DRAFT_1294833 [Pisolithus sp. B1]|nr:hypothetical protein F5141DRAFT_1294833 [Pisolithus sp. B1]
MARVGAGVVSVQVLAGEVTIRTVGITPLMEATAIATSEAATETTATEAASKAMERTRKTVVTILEDRDVKPLQTKNAVHEILDAPPLFGGSSANEAILFSPPFAFETTTDLTYPNYTLPSANSSLHEALPSPTFDLPN